MLITKRLTQEKPIIFDSNKERIININTISLESVDEKLPIDIYCENKRKKEIFKICSLKKGSQEIYSTSLILDLHDFKDKYEFTLRTKCKKAVVNIIGFHEEEEDDEENEKEVKEKQNMKKIEKKETKEKKENKEKIEIKEKKEKIEIKEKKEEKEILKEKLDSESDSDSYTDNDDLEDNKPNVSLIELLNKKRKEEPQEIKPITLKNLAGGKNKINNANNVNKNEKKENKDKDKFKDKNFLGKKFDKKDKKFLKK